MRAVLFGRHHQSFSSAEITGQHFTFEIVASMDGRERNYFCRADSAQASDDTLGREHHSTAPFLLHMNGTRRAAMHGDAVSDGLACCSVESCQPVLLCLRIGVRSCECVHRRVGGCVPRRVWDD
jgi:hypothetical protein